MIRYDVKTKAFTLPKLKLLTSKDYKKIPIFQKLLPKRPQSW